MRLCFGSYLAVLVSCKAVNVDNKTLCDALLHSVAPQFEFTFAGQENADRVREDVTSKLLRCEQNISKEITNAARKIDAQDVAMYFKENILRLLDVNKRKHIILALKDIIAKDALIQMKGKLVGIGDDTKIDIISGTTKGELATQNKFSFHSFLAGIFLFLIMNTSNRSGKDSIGSINDQYILSFTERVDEVNLIADKEILTTITTPKNQINDDTVLRLSESINQLIPIIKPDVDLLVTLIAEANGKCLKCGKELGIPRRGRIPTAQCDIVYLTLTDSEPKSYENAVALCRDTCAPEVAAMTVEEKQALLNNKRRLSDDLVLLDGITGIRIAKDIETVLREVDKVKNFDGLAEVDIAGLVDIDKKIYELSLREVINTRMKRLFKKVNEICGNLEQEIGFDTARFGSVMKFILETLQIEVEKKPEIVDPQEYVTSILVERLYSLVGQKYKVACEIIVAYLVKRCDLFNEITKQG